MPVFFRWVLLSVVLPFACQAVEPALAKSLQGTWRLEKCQPAEGLNSDLKINAINNGRDLEVLYLSKSGATTKNFSSLSERFTKTNHLLDDLFLVTTTEASELNGRLVVGAIHRQDDASKQGGPFLGANVTRLWVGRDGLLKYERDGWTVESHFREGAISLNCSFRKN